jgi:HPt (histidine-containing phosphotransfer) domain-containing protein
MQSPLGQASPGILDLDLALSQIGDVDAMNDMLLMLQESLAREVPRITALLDQGDVAGSNHLLHALKGFIPIFCAASFCERVVWVEGLSNVAASTELAPAYANLRPQLERLLAEVSAYTKSKGISA